MENSHLYLVHHGIKGMKWGKRNGPPYPLGESQKSLRERKHLGFEQKGPSTVKSASSTGKNPSAKSEGRLTHREKLIAKYKEQGMSQKEAEAAAEKRISMEKKVAIGAAIAVGAVAAYAAYKYVGGQRTGDAFGRLRLSTKMNLESQLMRKQFEASDFDMQINDDLRKINREGVLGHSFLLGRKVNCTSCSMAYEMRRRGYDVVAGKRLLSGRSNEQVEKFFQNGKFNQLVTTAKIDNFGLDITGNNPPLNRRAELLKQAEQALLSQGEGARGMLHGHYYGGGGHSIAYEVHNGRVHFVDGQIGRQYKDASEAIGLMTDIDFMRTDNLALTNSAAEAVMNNDVASLLTEVPWNSTVAMYGGIAGMYAYSARSNKKSSTSTQRSSKDEW